MTIRRRFLPILLLVVVACSPACTALAQPDEQDDDEIGLIDDTTWESPQFGIEATWDDDTFTPWRDGWSYSDTETGIDALALRGAGVTVEIYAIDTQGTDAAAYLDTLIDFRRDAHDDGGFDLLLADEESDRAWYAYISDHDGGSVLTFGEFRTTDDEIFLVSQLSAWTDDVESGFAAAQEDIEIDRAAPFGIHWNETTIADLDVATDTDGESWTAPQFDTTVAWGDDWTLVEDATESFAGDFDNLRLVHDEDAYVQVTIATLFDETLRQWMDRQLAFREEGADTESITVLDEGWIDGGRSIAYAWTTTDGDTWIVYREVRETDDAEVVRSVEVFTLAADPQDTVDLAQDTITIDDAPPFVRERPLDTLEPGTSHRTVTFHSQRPATP